MDKIQAKHGATILFGQRCQTQDFRRLTRPMGQHLKSLTESSEHLLRAQWGAALRLALGAAVLCCPALAQAVIQQHTFSIAGDGGETGTGYFTWDDQVVSNGSPVSASLSDLGNIIDLRIEISGGNVIGGTTVFTESDCLGAYAQNAPDFAVDINFNCNNTVNTVSGFTNFINYMNDTADAGAGVRPPALGGANSSTLTFTAGVTAPALGAPPSSQPWSIPTLPLWALMILTAVIAALGRGAPGGRMKGRRG